MKTYDFSNGSANPYTVSERHNLIPPCMQCGEDSTITLDGNDYYRYFVMGENVSLFKYLSLKQRELLITGIHPECQDEFYQTGE